MKNNTLHPTRQKKNELFAPHASEKQPVTELQQHQPPTPTIFSFYFHVRENRQKRHIYFFFWCHLHFKSPHLSHLLEAHPRQKTPRSILLKEILIKNKTHRRIPSTTNELVAAAPPLRRARQERPSSTARATFPPSLPPRR